MSCKRRIDSRQKVVDKIELGFRRDRHCLEKSSLSQFQVRPKLFEEWNESDLLARLSSSLSRTLLFRVLKQRVLLDGSVAPFRSLYLYWRKTTETNDNLRKLWRLALRLNYGRFTI